MLKRYGLEAKLMEHWLHRLKGFSQICQWKNPNKITSNKIYTKRSKRLLHHQKKLNVFSIKLGSACAIFKDQYLQMLKSATQRLQPVAQKAGPQKTSL
jgi:hypothetical protein